MFNKSLKMIRQGGALTFGIFAHLDTLYFDSWRLVDVCEAMRMIGLVSTALVSDRRLSASF